jgi:hypothetical protein
MNRSKNASPNESGNYFGAMPKYLHKNIFISYP